MADVETRDSDPVWQQSPGFWSHPFRGRPRWAVVLVVAALVAALTAGGLWLRSALAGPQAEAGDFVSGSRVVGLTDFATVRLPWGNLKVSSGRPADRIPDADLYSSKFEVNANTVDPPDDGSWLSVKIDGDLPLDSPLFRSRPDATIPATTVSVVSGGRTIPIVKAGGGGKRSTAQVIAAQLAPAVEGYLALPDRPGDARLRVEFAGERQDVHLFTGRIESGRMAPLYRASEKVARVCSRPVVPGYRPGYGADRDCGMNRLAVVPYVAGLGWARPGRNWLVTTVYSTAPPQWFRSGVPGKAGAYYVEEFGSGKSVLQYGNAAPRAQASFNRVTSSVFQDVEDPNQYIFDVPSSDTGKGVFTVKTRFLVRLGRDGDPRLPEQVELTATRTIRP